MTEVRLMTRNGGLVADKVIPPFQPLPDMLMWGQRAFMLDYVPRLKGEKALYKECMLYHIIDAYQPPELKDALP